MTEKTKPKFEFSDTLGNEVVGVIETTVRNLNEIDRTFLRPDRRELSFYKEKTEEILGAFVLQKLQQDEKIQAKPADLFKTMSYWPAVMDDDFFNSIDRIRIIETDLLKWTAVRGSYLFIQEQKLTEILEGTIISATSLTDSGFDTGNDQGRDSHKLGRNTQKHVAAFYGLNLPAGEIQIGDQDLFRIVTVFNRRTLEKEATLAIARSVNTMRA